MEHLAVLVIPLALVFAIVHDRWRRIGNWLTFLLMLFAFGTPWAINYFLPDRLGAMSQEIIFLFLPLFTLIGLYWIRWWAIRPPRILSDLANRL
jgi:Flp pilus assembly protein protease CpaA